MALACAGCAPSPPAGTVRSEQWGFTAVVPPDLDLVFVGPARASCHGAEGANTQVRRPRGADTALTAPDTVLVRFTRAPFAEVAQTSGFATDESSGQWRALGSEYSGDAHYERGAGWETLEGSAQTRLTFPNAGPDEPPFVFENVTLSLARFEHADGCALVLRVYQIGGGPGVAPLFRSVQLLARER